MHISFEGVIEMNWVEEMQVAIAYIEDNLTEDITIKDIASRAHISSFYFQKAFSMLCGYTIWEYIRKRRLSLAGSELQATGERVIDIAIKYGYESPDSFAKAFTRFHGITPSQAKKEGAAIKDFAPLKIIFSLKGGYIMDYRIEEKKELIVVGVSRQFNTETSYAEIPEFWTEHYEKGMGKYINGKYGICMDNEDDNCKTFDYLIADDYKPETEIPVGCVTKTISANTWAIFPCYGAMPKALQEVNSKIFSEWLPNQKDYKIAGNYNIEMYSDGNTKSDDYYSEIWVPVEKKV